MSGLALVLSGGGMFGAYQAGVWAELSRLGQPSIVVGASVGALNGWAIAGGMPGEQLAEEWLDPARQTPPRFRWPASLYDGILDSAALESWIAQLHAAWTPKLRLGITLTRLWDFQQELVEPPAITWQHLAASCGVPLFLRQYRLNGHRYADGGLVTALPVWAALKMGATSLITVNVLAGGRDDLAAAGARLLRWVTRFRPPTPACPVVSLDPPQPLGAPREMMTWNRDRIRRWIEEGRAAVHRNKHLLCDMFFSNASIPCSPDEGRVPPAIPLGRPH